MQLARIRWLAGSLLGAIGLVSTLGCAGPGWGRRLLPAPMAAAAPAAPQHVAGQMPLPPAQGVRPASVRMTAERGHNQRAIQDTRPRRSGLLGGRPFLSGCSS